MAPEMNMMSQSPFPGQQIHRLFQLYPVVHMDVPCSDPEKISVVRSLAFLYSQPNKPPLVSSKKIH